MEKPSKIETDDLKEVKRENQSSQLVSDDVEEQSSSPPSSPPVVESAQIQTERVSPPRKRSHDEMNAKSEHKSHLENAHDSSSTVVDDGGHNASQEEPNLGTAKTSSTTVHSMAPPPLPTSRKLRSLEEPPQSAQGSPKLQPAASSTGQEAAKVADSRAQTSDSDDNMRDHAESSQAAAIGPPEDMIDDFDWRDLEQRYHAKIEELNANENAIMTKFNDLCKFFELWAQCGSVHEVDRSYKRLKTQMTLVQHHEDELEQKRLHYVKVIAAFQIAELLSDSDLAEISRQAAKRSAKIAMALHSASEEKTCSTKQEIQTIISSNDHHPARCVIL